MTAAAIVSGTGPTLDIVAITVIHPNEAEPAGVRNLRSQAQ
jgi:hypothetical protein